MAVAVECVAPELEPEERRPLAVMITPDELVQARSRRFIREVGATAMAAIVEVPDAVKGEGSRYPTLADAIHAARAGDAEAWMVIQGNARTQAAESAVKAGIVLEVPLEVDAQGRLVQHGQLLRDVYKNALLHASATPEIRERTEAEISNGFMLEHLIRCGVLEGRKTEHGQEKKKNIAILSRPPENMSETDADRAGFFIDTMSCAIQVIRMKDGRLIQESAFVAGRASPGAPRHDRQTIEKMLALLGISAEGVSVTELLGRPLLIDADSMPNGAVDLARLYDEAAGGTFFGQAKLRQDYLKHIEANRRFLDQLEPIVQQIVALVVAKGDQVRHPVDAVKLLHNVAQDRMLEFALQHSSIDARVFHEAAPHIEAARLHLAQGNMQEFQRARQAAQGTARTSSCPSSLAERQAMGQDREGTEEDQLPKNERVGKIRMGYCRTPNCPSAGKKTLVGECSVCLYCQSMWDHGIDPSTVSRPKRQEKVLGELLMASIQMLLSERQRTKKQQTAHKAGELAAAA